MRNPRRKLKLIELDGRTLEGGGQLLRLAICLSALTSIPVRITDIRGKRKGGGGLKTQHVACVKWLGQACGADVTSVARGVSTLHFEPGSMSAAMFRAEQKDPLLKPVIRDGIQGLKCRMDIETSGSTGLALQAILPYILFSKQTANSPVSLTLTGGTNVSGSPSYEYLTQVLFPTLETIGLPSIIAKLEKRGWSTGRPTIGEFTLEIPPRQTTVLQSFELYPVQDPAITVIKHVEATFLAPADCHDHFRQSFLQIVQPHLRQQLDEQGENSLSRITTINIEDSQHPQRMYLILVATMADESRPEKPYRLASDWLYQRKVQSSTKTSAEMVEGVVRQLAIEIASRARVDEHMRDQLVVFRALAGGHTRAWPGVCQQPGKSGTLRPASLHAQTAEWVAHRMLGAKFSSAGDARGVAFDGENWEDVAESEDYAKEIESLEDHNVGQAPAEFQV